MASHGKQAGGRRWSAAGDEQRFREDVKIGDVWVKKVAERLRAYGLWDITVPEVKIRTQFDDRRAFRDDGDLFVNGRRVEIRSFGFRFLSAADFPRGQVQVELARVMAAKANVAAYLFVSRQTGAVVGLVGCDLHALHRKNAVWNARRGVARDWMVADAGRLLDWAQVVNYLAEKAR